jgi:hypothetical protein
LCVTYIRLIFEYLIKTKEIMTTLNAKIENLLKQMNNDMLIEKLKETFGNMKMMKMNVAIQAELEERIGEDKLDAILDGLR